MPVDPQALTEEFLAKLGFPSKVTTAAGEDGSVRLNIETEQASRLIGEDGHTLLQIQYLINRMIYTADPNHPRVTLDVGGYRERLREARRAEALAAAEKVRRWGDIVELEPMNAYDRWVVHQALKDDPAVETYSVEVEGTDKKVIILRPRRNAPSPDGDAG
ncbi:MAG: single-stranded DNA-binding protein [Verrucomicrobia bacterium]|nr:MAG: single-stranded DNA-binding protein [Verrucomicrobiota bacterium]